MANQHKHTPEIDQRAYEEWKASGLSKSEAALNAGVPRATYAQRIQRHMTRMDQDPAIADAMDDIGTGMVPSLVWAKTKNKDGTSHSILLKPDPLPEETLQRIREAFEGMQPTAPVDTPADLMTDLCTIYPIMDAHYGLHAWGRETGDVNYNGKLARSDMWHAFSKVTAITPASQRAILLIGGDFFHADNDLSVTPKHKHPLDVDGRHFKTLDMGIQLIASVIDLLLKKHADVAIRVIRGNHDENTHMTLTFALAERYRNEPRADVEKNPSDFYMTQHGKCLIAAHHGDKAPPERLTLYLSDVCPYWSETRHRYCLTGHVHKDQARDVGPLRWESLRAFCPPDAYAAGMGYSARRALQSLTFHSRDGLVLRAIDPIERENSPKTA